MLDERWHNVKKVLLIRLDNLGDVLLTTPAIHAVRSALPSVSLTLLASRIGAQAGALNPDLDDVIVYPAPWMDPWQKMPQDSEREQRMIAEIQVRHFDAAIIFTSFRQSPLPAAYLCYLADIPLRVAASIDGPGSLLTTRHKHPETIVHEVERGLNLVRAIGISTDEHDLVLNVPDEAMIAIAQRLKERILGTNGVGEDEDTLIPTPTWHSMRDDCRQGDHKGTPLLIVVHPGCTMPARTYPWEMYVEVINLLVEQLGAFVVVTGADDERELVARVVEHVHVENRHATLAMAGMLPFPEFCALIKTADLTITNNTGPMHISAAVKTPVIALFALTNPPEQWSPWHVPHRQLYHDVPCRICYSRICPYQHECLRLVSPSMVIAAAVELLNEVANEHQQNALHYTNQSPRGTIHCANLRKEVQ